MTVVVTTQPGVTTGVRPALLPLLLVTLAVYLVTIGLATRHYHFNLSALLAVGDGTEPAARARLLGHHVVVFQHSQGFDGQLYYYVADDPIPLARQPVYCNPFYYQRLMYPLLTAIVSAGQRDVRPLVMVLINVVAIAVCAWLSWLLALDYFAEQGSGGGGGSGTGTLTFAGRSIRPSWWILLAVINPSLMLALQLDLPEPLAYACTLGGLLAWRRGRVVLGAVCFATALLTREVTIMVILPVVIVTALRRRWIDTAILAAAALPYLAWRVALARILPGTNNATTWASDFGLPFGGIVATIRGSLQELEQHQLRSFVIHQGSVLAVVVVVLAAGVLGLWQLRRGGDPIVAGTFLTAAAVGIVGSGGVWDAYANAGRDFGLIFPMLVFALAARRPYRSLALWLCVLSALLTLFTLYRGLAVTPSVAYTLTP